MRERAEAEVGVVIPFYNEEEYLPQTLECLTSQSHPPSQVVLVDNASTDASPQLAREFCSRFAGDAQLLSEPEPGKARALRRGCAAIRTEWTSTWDADTFYPPEYVANIVRLAQTSGSGVAAIMALDGPRDEPARRAVVQERLKLHQKFPNKCFTGGFGQTFRTETLERAGSFQVTRWPFVLMDHEIVHRVHQHGSSVYDAEHWCCPSDRRSDRQRVRWSLFERVLYRNTPKALEPWFFYSFLFRRFEKKGMRALRLREQAWNPNKSTHNDAGA